MSILVPPLIVETRLRKYPLTADLILTARQETDARTAITRGLAEYTSQVRGIAAGGRELLFAAVFDTWADFEDSAEYPSAVVMVPEDITYSDARLTPEVNGQRFPLPDGRSIIVGAELEFDAAVEVWCTDTEERAMLVAALEEAYNPVDWMYGFNLELPHYFGTSARFELKALRYDDSDEDAMKRYRRAVLTLGCGVPVIRLSRFPDALPAADVRVGLAPL